MTLTHEDFYKGYVKGFLFSPDLDQVILSKDHDGIGGKVINGGSHRTAIWKRFQEVTGYNFDDWQYVKSIPIDGKIYQHIWCGISGDFESTEDKVQIVDVEQLNGPIKPLVTECLNILKTQ